MNPLVSILICTYNAENTIEETIRSCLNQTYKNIEILIHDDQSKDNTIDIINKIWDKRIKIIDSWKKLWPYKGLNFLLDHAKWEYIAIQDHDDLWYPTKIEKQVKFLEGHTEYVGCWTNTLIRFEWDNKWYEYYLWDRTSYTIHPSLVFRNEWYRYPEELIYMCDAFFQKTVLCKWERRIHNLKELLTIHRVKDWAENYSYKRFKFNTKTIKTLFNMHKFWYWCCVFWFEMMRKIVYPFLHFIKKPHLIDKIERFPFIIMWYKIIDIDVKAFPI